MSLCLCLVLSIFAWFQPGTVVIKNWIISVLVLSTGFFISGIGASLPVWGTVICANIILLSAGVTLHSGLVAYSTESRAKVDWCGWGVVLLTIPAFWQWGLIEPNGQYRSMVFSLATAAINGRTAILLLRSSLKRGSRAPLSAMALLFVTLTAWMLVRFVVLILSDPAPPDLRGANPTKWMTVFGYIVLVSSMSICLMWMEVNRLNIGGTDSTSRKDKRAGFVDYLRNKILLIWSAMTILIVGIASMLGIGYVNFRETEKARLILTTDLVNGVFVEHTIQLVAQVDSILRSVRSFYLHTHSIAETELFIQGLGFDRSAIDNIYLITPDGRVAISHDPTTVGRTVSDREYFKFHHSTSIDKIYIGPVEPGRITGKFHFRITRRIDKPDGSFGGLVLATVKPESFAQYYRNLKVGPQGLASLLGIEDRKLRARVPEPPVARWTEPVDSPLWELLLSTTSGIYENTSQVDNIRRFFVFRKVGEFSLVMVTGFSDDDLKIAIRERMSLLVITSIVILLFTVMLALLLTIETRRRDDQNSFMSMLSHELKTPLSVLRLALGSESMLPGIRKHAERAVEDMNAVIERCLQVDRLKHGRFSRKNEPLRIDVILEEVASLCTDPERLTMEIAPLPECSNDPQILRIILGNLIDNALKYGAVDSFVAITAAPVIRYDKVGIGVRVTNKIGPSGLPDPGRVFKKYYRAAGAHTKTGSGLGLYLAANLAQLIKAELRYLPVDSEISFDLWVPL